MEVDPRIANLLTEKLEVEAELVVPGAALQQLELDSLAQVEFVDSLQSEFGVTVDDDEVTGAMTLDEVTELLRSKGASL
ncbi:acyl carrier protein [Streptomyces longwoodensis]|uniref:acyl carrier protein n=1 Tax=Streptomyces longwoodensis TaxID=68231 RepID=UPI0033D84B2E